MNNPEQVDHDVDVSRRERQHHKRQVREFIPNREPSAICVAHLNPQQCDLSQERSLNWKSGKMEL